VDWKESGRAERWADLVRKARGSATPTEWAARTGINRTRWLRYEEGTPPQTLEYLWDVAQVLNTTVPNLIAAIDGNPPAPQGATLEEMAENFSDREFEQLCELKDGDTLVRWISLASRVLSSRITQDKQESSP